jgi:hypothetical protein
MGRVRTLVQLTVFVVMLLGTNGMSIFAQRAARPQTQAGSAGVLQTREANISGVVAELTECRREEGVLNIKVRFRNTSDESKSVAIISALGPDYDSYYVTAGTRKYLVLRDSEGIPLAPSVDRFGSLEPTLKAGEAWTWWAKYPAPPASDSKINYMTPFGAPFEDVPISH